MSASVKICIHKAVRIDATVPPRQLTFSENKQPRSNSFTFYFKRHLARTPSGGGVYVDDFTVVGNCKHYIFPHPKLHIIFV